METFRQILSSAYDPNDPNSYQASVNLIEIITHEPVQSISLLFSLAQSTQESYVIRCLSLISIKKCFSNALRQEFPIEIFQTTMTALFTFFNDENPTVRNVSSSIFSKVARAYLKLESGEDFLQLFIFKFN